MEPPGPESDRWIHGFVIGRWVFLVFHATIAAGSAHWWMNSGGSRGVMEGMIRWIVALQLLLAGLGIVIALQRRITARASAESVTEAWVYLGISLLTCFTISLALH